MQTTAVGVVGAGVKGGVVANELAQAGQHVVLLDNSEDALADARQEIKDSVRAFALFNKGAIPDTRELLARIHYTAAPEQLAAVSFVIENVTEKWEIKKPLYEQLDSICPPEVVFAANTSAIPITKIASATRRAPRVLGMHFMNPVPMKDMVEVIRGYHTSAETIEVAKALLAKMNKECVVVEDSPGFVTNRVLMLTINEAIFLVHEGVSSAPDIDRLFRSCFGHKMGPLETADLIGLDTILLSLEALYENMSDPKFRPCPLLRKMVAAGLHGKKSGEGFYPYR